MVTNLVRFCTAALAGSIIGITYERWSVSRNQYGLENIDANHGGIQWPKFGFDVVTASSGLTPSPRQGDVPSFGGYGGGKGGGDDIFLPDPKLSAENLRLSSRFGLPSKDNIRLFNDFIISYDRRLRAPIWVMEHLTPEKLTHRDDGVHRNKSKFREDVTLHEFFRAKLADFAKSGLDRGHMAAAGNHKIDQRALDQTFILSNISPQEPEFNRGGWERLETFVRWRAKRVKNVYCVTGPLFLPIRARDGKVYVTYQVIGRNQVSVPTHFYKVILFETNDNNLNIEAFILPNDNSVSGDIQLDNYRVPIDRLDVIERAAGVIFFGQLERERLAGPNRLPPEFKEGPPRGPPEQLAARN